MSFMDPHGSLNILNYLLYMYKVTKCHNICTIWRIMHLTLLYQTMLVETKIIKRAYSCLEVFETVLCRSNYRNLQPFGHKNFIYEHD